MDLRPNLKSTGPRSPAIAEDAADAEDAEDAEDVEDVEDAEDAEERTRRTEDADVEDAEDAEDSEDDAEDGCTGESLVPILQTRVEQGCIACLQLSHLAYHTDELRDCCCTTLHGWTTLSSCTRCYTWIRHMVLDHGDADICTWVSHWSLRTVDNLGEEQL